MSEIIRVTNETLDEVVLGAAGPVFFAIGAPWCVDCRRAQPFVEALAKTYGDRMTFAAANCDECPGLRERFNVKHIPTMYVMKDGRPVNGELVEVKTPGELRDFIEEGLRLAQA